MSRPTANPDDRRRRGADQVAPVTPVPAGCRIAFDRLRLAPDARVLVVPIPNVGAVLAWRL